MARLKQGTILVTTNYIKCNMLGFQFDAGRELKYVSTYNGMYIVEFADKSYMSDYNGYAGVLMVVNPRDVKIKSQPNQRNKSQVKPKKETWTHNTVIDSEMVGKCYSVYTGSRFVPVTPKKRDIGKTLLSVATSN